MTRRVLIYAMLIIASCSPRIVTVAVHDTTTVTRIETVRDTIISAPLPVESVIISTPDTTSTVETSLAASTATITGGHLRHTIENKHTSISVPAKIPERQEVIYKTREIPVPIEVPKPYIPKWVWWVLAYAGVTTLLIIASIYFRARL